MLNAKMLADRTRDLTVFSIQGESLSHPKGETMRHICHSSIPAFQHFAFLLLCSFACAAEPTPDAESLTLPPAPALVAMGTVPAATSPASNPEQTVADLRLALRRRNYAQAEAYLAALPIDTAGYRDLVKMIAPLRDEQNAAYAALGAALKTRRCGELAAAILQAATLPDLAAATAQAQAYLAMTEGVYDRIFVRIHTAVAAKDLATANAQLALIPTETAVLPPVTVVKRAAAAQAIANLSPQ